MPFALSAQTGVAWERQYVPSLALGVKGLPVKCKHAFFYTLLTVVLPYLCRACVKGTEVSLCGFAKYPGQTYSSYSLR
jgi:hypothetical protein